MHERVCSVSVDLDPLRCYYDIHGLGETPERVRDVVLKRGLPRFAELFERYGISSTLFVVASDLEQDPVGRATLGRLARAGHELGNHSHTHPYDLARRSREEIEDEVGRAHRAIGDCAGAPPVGFRAPGYDVSERLFESLAAHGYRYDSSIFPSVPYYLAKAGVMGMMATVGRATRSVIVDPRQMISPTMPYRPGRTPYRRGQSTLVELPVSVTPGLRLPAIGTTLLVAPERVRTGVLEAMRKRAFFNLEFHGIDLVGADEDGIPTKLVAKQPDLRVSLDEKIRRLSATFDRLRAEYRFAPLRDVAATVQREGHA